jgi:arylsulfatase A-like enzyme
VARPNIVFILTDDQTWNSLRAMPFVEDKLVRHGVQFTKAFVVNSLCCPSRASILTGQYSHSTGVYTNKPPTGGFPAFHPHEGSTIATWLHRVGYRTGLVGKYLNYYGKAGRSGYVPPGWDRWVAFAENNGLYYDYHLSMDGQIRHYGASPADYSTDVLWRYAVNFIRHTTRRPFFLYFAPFAPHGPSTPAPRDAGRFSRLAPYRPPNFNERDVSDKPRWVRALPRLSSSRIARIDKARRKAYASLLAVDHAVAGILGALRDTGRLHNTMIVFTSDNGFAFGEHRWFYKMSPYEESIRVPLVIRYDPLTWGGRKDRHLALNIDVAPTFAALAGAQPSTPVDGRSLLPILRRRGQLWRHQFLIEHKVTQLDQPYVPAYCAVRSAKYLYSVYKYETEPRYNSELYDLVGDPYELVNRVKSPRYASVVAAMKARLKALCNPPPPGFTLPF